METDSECLNNNMLHEVTFNSTRCSADELEKKEIGTQLVRLPDISEAAIAGHKEESKNVDSEWLMNPSVGIWQAELEKQAINQEATHLERYSAFKSFISTGLDGMPFDEWEVFVYNDVPKKYYLKAKDIKTAVAEIAKEKHNETKNKASNLEEEVPVETTETEDRLGNYPENIRDYAV